jgi:hypothetical protein
MSIQQLNNLNLKAGLEANGDVGEDGQVLSSTGPNGVEWINQSAITASSDFIYYEVKNETGSTILKGKGIMAVGTDGNSGHILVDEMVADGTIAPRYFLGVLETSVDNGGFARVIAFGELDQFNTNGQNGETWSNGQVLWCDPDSPGDFTIIEPLGPNVKIPAAFVLKASTQGKIQVRVQANEGVKDLYDTKIDSQVDGDVLVWDNTTGVWFNNDTLSVKYSERAVAIGDFTPPISGKLQISNEATDVWGTLIQLNSTGTQSRMSINNNGTGDSQINFQLLGSSKFTLGVDNSDSDKFKISGSSVLGSNDRFVIDSSGNVGIGTTSPVDKLDVRGTARIASPQANDWIVLAQNYATGASSGFWDSNGSVHLYLRDSSSNTKVLIKSDSSSYFNGGNVGVGTDSPDVKLEVESTTSANGIRIKNTNSGFASLDIESNRGTGANLGGLRYRKTGQSYSQAEINYVADTRFDFLLGNGTATPSNKLSILENGNVGIGTTSPDSKLQISGSGTQRLRVTSTDGANADLSCDGTSSMTLGSPNGIPLRFATSNAERMRIQSSGSVGIGTTSPGEKLTVKGTDQYIAVEQTTYPWGGTNTLGLKMGTNGVSGLLDWRRWTGSGTDHGTAVIAQVNSDGGYGLDFRVNNQSTNTPATTSRMFLSSSGEVGIGTTSPAYQLQLSLNSAAKPTSSAWTVVSDERVKTNIRPYETGLEELLQVKPKIFDYNGKAGFDTKAKNNIGVIAQEIKDVIPETVKKYNAKLNKEDKEDTELYNFDSHALTFALINSVKELNAKIEQLETRIQTLENN